MAGVLLLSLVGLVALTCAVGSCMFLDVAFAPVDRRFARGPLPKKRFDPAALAHQVESTLGRMLQRISVSRPTSSRCEPACYQHEVRVTTPEVLAIVGELHECCSRAELASIRDRAERNVAAASCGVCPLRTALGTCACETSRPLMCQSRCVSNCSPQAQEWAETVGDGATEVFRECLQASGVDAEMYELNHALVTALKTPHAGQRWARGERVLASSGA